MTVNIQGGPEGPPVTRSLRFPEAWTLGRGRGASSGPPSLHPAGHTLSSRPVGDRPAHMRVTVPVINGGGGPRGQPRALRPRLPMNNAYFRPRRRWGEPYFYPQRALLPPDAHVTEPGHTPMQTGRPVPGSSGPVGKAGRHEGPWAPNGFTSDCGAPLCWPLLGHWAGGFCRLLPSSPRDHR